MKKVGILVVALFCCLKPVLAQDSLEMIGKDLDTVLVKTWASRYDPRKALLYSAVFPGLGQIYNKKYWKLPLIYGGAGALYYAENLYQKGYRKYRFELFNLLTNDPKGTSPSGYTLAQLRTLVDSYRRERDYFLIISMGVYLLQIVDAHVDAHLKEFDLNPELKLGFHPFLSDDLWAGRNAGFAFTLKF